MKNLLLALGLVIALVPVSSIAGKLDDFETSATENKHERRDSRRHPPSRENRDEGHHHQSDGGCHSFFSCLFQIYIHVDASSPSTDTYEETEQSEYPPDESGQQNNPPAGPLVTVDLAYQYMEPGIFGLDSSFKLRLKWVNIEGRFTRIVETSPYDILDVSQLNVVFPIRLSRSLTVGGSIGLYQLAGNNVNTGVSFGAPILFRARGSKWEFGMTPSWTSFNGNLISDIDFRVNYRNRSTNIFAGSRAIGTGTQLISGPYVGIGLNF